MPALDKYIKVLQQLTHLIGLRFDTQAKENNLVIHGVAFSLASRKDLHINASATRGLLFSSLTEDERQFCAQHRINFLTLDGHFQLVSGQTVFSITQEKKIRRWGSSKTKSKNPLLPTLIFSPYALSILDVLVKVPKSELLQATSVLSFAKRYGLYQPKLSKLMRELDAEDLASLKAKIVALPDDWWSLAFQYPATKKRLTPFFDSAMPFHSLDNKSITQDEFDSTLFEMKGCLIPGPVEIAKKHGVINDMDYYLWAEAQTLQEFKRLHKLVPGKLSSGPTWYLATPKRDLHQEAIASYFTALSSVPTELANPFRAIWDLSFGSERLKEIRMTLLRRLLK